MTISGGADADGFSYLRPDRAKEIAMPPAKGRSPEDDASQTVITLKQMAAELADSHNLSNKQAEALLDDLMTLATPPYQERPQGRTHCHPQSW